MYSKIHCRRRFIVAGIPNTTHSCLQSTIIKNGLKCKPRDQYRIIFPHSANSSLVYFREKTFSFHPNKAKSEEVCIVSGKDQRRSLPVCRYAFFSSWYLRKIRWTATFQYKWIADSYFRSFCGVKRMTTGKYLCDDRTEAIRRKKVNP